MLCFMTVPLYILRVLIVSHSTKRAEKDRRDRVKSIENLQQKLEKSKNPTSLISNYGYKKYLTVDGDVQVRINEDKLEREALWDGLHGVMTNIKEDEMKADEILSQYHGLWQVEESFRISKHDLRVRPVFHWSADRIKAHIAICFVSFALIRFLQYLVWHREQVLSLFLYNSFDYQDYEMHHRHYRLSFYYRKDRPFNQDYA